MTNRELLIATKRQHHNRQWLSSGMKKNDHARQHSIHTMGFGNLCHRVAAQQQPSHQPRSLLPVADTTATVPECVTSSLHSANLTGLPQAIAILFRELKLC
ncbi:TPA: hypothetical protein ACSP7Z_002672 [Serratia fonticola]